MKNLDVFSNLPILETERLQLRQVTIADVMDIWEFLSNPEVIKYTRYKLVSSFEEAQQVVLALIHKYQHGEVARWGFVHKADLKVIGLGGFASWDKEDNRGELSFLFSQEYWGKRYAIEALETIVKFGFSAINLNRIEALCKPENLSAHKVLERLGLTYEGILRAIL